jgi:histone deacetylase 6
LFISIHRFNKGFFPETGAHTEAGAGPGRGFTVNIPVPIAVGDLEYLSAWRRVVVPVAQAFQPDLVLLSAGFDCLKGDPLGGLSLSPGKSQHMYSFYSFCKNLFSKTFF